MADPVRRDAAQRVIECLDADRRPLAAFGNAGLGIDQVVGHQPRIVDLQQEARLDDRLVFLAHRVGDGEQIVLRLFVIGVAHPVFDVGGRDRRNERLDLGAADRGLQVGDVALNQLVTGPVQTMRMPREPALLWA